MKCLSNVNTRVVEIKEGSATMIYFIYNNHMISFAYELCGRDDHTLNFVIADGFLSPAPTITTVFKSDIDFGEQ